MQKAMSKDTSRLSKEPLKISNLISKVGTFRGKKHNQRPSASDLGRFESINDESIMTQNSDHQNSGSYESTDLDTTKTFNFANQSNYTHRSSVQTLIPIVNIYGQMTDEQINEEFEKSLLVNIIIIYLLHKCYNHHVNTYK